ncbi:MAG: hypothetical protein ACLSAF_11145 [Intestinimonas sp.]
MEIPPRVAGSAGGHLPGGLAGQVGGVVRRCAAAPLRPGAGGRPIPLRWRESLPYLPVLLLVNAVPPAVLALLDAPDVPVLRALLIPCLLLPLGGFFPALSLGKRQGVCLLYPAASLLIFLPASLWVYGGQRIPLFWGIALACPWREIWLGPPGGGEKRGGDPNGMAAVDCVCTAASDAVAPALAPALHQKTGEVSALGPSSPAVRASLGCGGVLAGWGLVLAAWGRPFSGDRRLGTDRLGPCMGVCALRRRKGAP